MTFVFHGFGPKCNRTRREEAPFRIPRSLLPAIFATEDSHNEASLKATEERRRKRQRQTEEGKEKRKMESKRHYAANRN